MSKWCAGLSKRGQSTMRRWRRWETIKTSRKVFTRTFCPRNESTQSMAFDAMAMAWVHVTTAMATAATYSLALSVSLSHFLPLSVSVSIINLVSFETLTLKLRLRLKARPHGARSMGMQKQWRRDDERTTADEKERKCVANKISLFNYKEN